MAYAGSSTWDPLRALVPLQSEPMWTPYQQARETARKVVEFLNRPLPDPKPMDSSQSDALYLTQENRDTIVRDFQIHFNDLFQNHEIKKIGPFTLIHNVHLPMVYVHEKFQGLMMWCTFLESARDETKAIEDSIAVIKQRKFSFLEVLPSIYIDLQIRDDWGNESALRIAPYDFQPFSFGNNDQSEVIDRLVAHFYDLAYGMDQFRENLTTLVQEIGILVGAIGLPVCSPLFSLDGTRVVLMNFESVVTIPEAADRQVVEKKTLLGFYNLLQKFPIQNIREIVEFSNEQTSKIDLWGPQSQWNLLERKSVLEFSARRSAIQFYDERGFTIGNEPSILLDPSKPISSFYLPFIDRIKSAVASSLAKFTSEAPLTVARHIYVRIREFQWIEEAVRNEMLSACLLDLVNQGAIASFYEDLHPVSEEDRGSFYVYY